MMLMHHVGSEHRQYRDGLAMPRQRISVNQKNIKAGDVFERLTAVRFFEWKRKNGDRWVFLCVCGVEKVINVRSVMTGDTRSCGCLRDEKIRNVYLSHGMSRTSEHNIWLGITQRCCNPLNKLWEWYGGRGISMCERWRKFENFYADMGPRPVGMSVERVDNEKGYSPENCKWASRHDQTRNKRNNIIVQYEEQSMCLKDFAVKIGIKYHILYYRMAIKGWTLEKAITKKIRKSTNA